MIAGIGIDITRVARIAKSIARPRFIERVYGESERAMLSTRAWRPESAAANFAAKEAFAKALGTGLWHEFSPYEAEALRDEHGAPFFTFTGRAAALMTARRLTAHLSLTHEGGCAAAFVVLEHDDGLPPGPAQRALPFGIPPEAPPLDSAKGGKPPLESHHAQQFHCCAKLSRDERMLSAAASGGAEKKFFGEVD